MVADEQGGGDSSYVGQLRAFAAAIAAGPGADPVPMSAANAVVTMRMIDDACRAALRRTRQDDPGLRRGGAVRRRPDQDRHHQPGRR